MLLSECAFLLLNEYVQVHFARVTYPLYRSMAYHFSSTCFVGDVVENSFVDAAQLARRPAGHTISSLEIVGELYYLEALNQSYPRL